MSRWVPSSGPRPEWPDEPDDGQGYNGEQGAQRNGHGYDGTGRGAAGQNQYGRDGAQYGESGNDAQGYGRQQQSYGAQDYDRNGYQPQAYGEQAYGEQGYGERSYRDQGYAYPAEGGFDTQGRNRGQYGGYDADQTQTYNYHANGNGNGSGYSSDGGQPGYSDGRARGNMQHYQDGQGQGYQDGQAYQNGQGYQDGQAYQNGSGYDATRQYETGRQYETAQRPDSRETEDGRRYQGPGGPPRSGQRPGGQPGRNQPGANQPGANQRGGNQRGGNQPPGRPPGRKVRFRRTRRAFRRTSVRIISVVVALLLVWLMFSVGQATFKSNGQGFSANLAEWARDHDLGFAVTFGEWLGYNPPKTGGKPSFSYVVPKDEQPTPVKAGTGKKGSSFVPDIPAPLKQMATGAALAGEGQWRVVQKVKGYPAILTTFLRDSGEYTSYSNGIASFDQRLVKFSLRPGQEDPGSAPNSTGNWGVPNYIPSGQYAGLLATFNGGFKLDSAEGGFYLNGMYHGSLVKGAASVVYYKNGTVKVGEWGRDFKLNSDIVGVRQNLKLLVDHGKPAADANQDVETNWGATLGPGAWVWRSGIGITKDNRIVYVYGQSLDAQDLALLLQRAGAVEGMQLDINPSWMKFDIYTTHGNKTQPAAAPLLPTQQASVYSYMTPSQRDFTAVYAR